MLLKSLGLLLCLPRLAVFEKLQQVFLISVYKTKVNNFIYAAYNGFLFLSTVVFPNFGRIRKVNRCEEN